MPLADRYTDEIRTQLKRFANWEPGAPLALGDYGELRGSRFHRLGNVAALGVEFDVLEDPTSKHVSYASKGAVDFSSEIGADADVPTVAKGKATLEISFKAENAILFNAAGVRYDSMADHGTLGRQLLGLYAAGTWDPRHSVITELSRAGSTTVIISSGSSASILLVAEADAPTLDLADASVRFAPTLERNIGYKTIAEEGMIPLFGLSRVRPNTLFWWRQPEFQTRLGFTADEGQADPPVGFQASLEDEAEALRDQVRAEGLDPADAFEWVGQQPPDRPGREADG